MAYPLLPKLKEQNNNILIPESERGRWVTSEQNSVQSLIKGLDVQNCKDLACIAAIPDMWARPLLFEMALTDPHHILHKRIVGEWRGLLAVLALKELKNFEHVTVRSVEIGEEDNNSSLFIQTLYRLKPQHGIVGLSWDSLYVVLNNRKSLGMFSPGTLVCTAGDCNGALQGIQWSDGQFLLDPVPYLNRKEREILACWLQQLCDTLKKSEQTGVTKMMISLLSHHSSGAGDEAGFIDALVGRDGTPMAKVLYTDFHKYETDLLGVVVAALRPISTGGPEGLQSDVEIVPSAGKTPKQRLLIVDDGISIQWQMEPKDVMVANHASLSSIPFSKVIERDKFGGINLNGVAEIRTPKEFFLNQIHVIEKANAILGTSVDLGVYVNEQTMTAILPVTEELVYYFTSEDLGKIIKLQVLPGGDIVVSLTLPLSKGKSFRIEKKYEKAKDEICFLDAVNSVPVLEIWPDLVAENWKTYFTYCDRNINEESFVSQPYPFTEQQSRRIGQHKGKQSGVIYRSGSFPEGMLCSMDKNGTMKFIGAIPLQTPLKQASGANIWKVGVDFGTTNTNVFVSDGNRTRPLHLKTRMRQVCAGNITERQSSVAGNFISVDDDLNIPFLSFFHVPMEERPTGEAIPNDKMPLLDGHIAFFPSYDAFEAGKKGNHFDLKWGGVEERIYSKLFLRQLALNIAAEAAMNGVGKIDWRFSFPSAFSPGETSQLETAWEEIGNEILKFTGIGVFNGRPSAKSESVAAAYYFAQAMQAKFSRGVICMDIGGGSTDISVWQGIDQSLRLQTSLRFAGRDIFLRLLQKYPQFLVKFGSTQTEVKRLAEYADDNKKFVAQLDALIKQKGNSLLTHLNEHGREKDVRAFLSLMAIGLSGIFYYVGMLLADLGKRGRLNDKEGLPDVFVGGNGVRLFDWVAVGKYRSDTSIAELFRHMMKQGANDYASNGEVGNLFAGEYRADIILTPHPKEEVGFGLVTDDIKLTYDRTKKVSESAQCISGIEFEIGTEVYGWKTGIDETMIKTGIQISADSDRFASFVSYFNKNTKEAELMTVEIEKSQMAEARARVNDILVRTKSRPIEEIAPEPLFIMMLKAFLEVKADAWAKTCKD